MDGSSSQHSTLLWDRLFAAGGADRHIIAFITEAQRVRQILARLDEPTTPVPSGGSRRGPPLWEMADAGQGSFDLQAQPAPDYEFDLQPGDPATLADDTNTGKLFASQHSGLQRLPRDQGVAGDCAQIVEHVLAVDGAGKQYFEHSSIAGVPATISNLHGCPNEWAAREGYRDQLIGFQTMNDITEPADVDSTLWNMTANSNSAYYEIYEDAAWRIGKRFGTGSSAAVLDTSGHYPSMGAAFQKNLHRWGEQLHARRKAIAVQLAAFSNAADPFTADYSHTFDAPLPVGQTATYYFINPGRCSSAPVLNQAYGRIVVHNEL